MQTETAKKKILIPAFDFKPALGGVAHYTHELISALKDLGGVDIRVLARTQTNQESYDNSSPFPIYRITTPGTATLALKSWSHAIHTHIKTWQPDLILCPLWFPDAVATELAQLFLKTKTPYSVVVHAMEVLPAPMTLKLQIREKLLWPLRKKVFLKSRNVFCVSQYSKNLTLKTTGISPKKVHVVNNGVNLEIYKKSSPSNELRKSLGAEGKILLTVTRLRPYKGIDKVLESLPAVLQKFPDLKYVIVGEGSDRARLDELVKSLNLSENIVFLGPKDQQTIIDLYNLADLFIMLSREEHGDVEGFGLVFLEAMACGLASLGGQSGGIPDAIDDNRSGWLVSPTDVHLITKKIIEILSNDSLRAQARDYGLQMVKNRSWQKTAQKIKEILIG